LTHSTVFRELLQNSDDARAERVQIRFDTQAHLDKLAQPPLPPPKLSSNSAGIATEAEVPINTKPAPTPRREKAPDLKTLQVRALYSYIPLFVHLYILAFLAPSYILYDLCHTSVKVLT
jgi:hypothetical protein